MKLSRRITTLNGKDARDDGWSVWYRARDLMAAGQDVTLLCIGDHDSPTPAPVIEQTKSALDCGQTRYAPVNGTAELRASIATRTEQRTDVKTEADNIFVSNGGQGALFAAMMGATDPGDRVVIVDPYYTTYPATVNAASCDLKILPTRPEDGFQPDPDALMAATRGARALLINTPNNPTGAVYSAATLEGIRKAALANDLWVISDEVYDTQIHDGTHISPRTLPDMAERTLVIGSLSKSHVMTGFRLGWLAGPPEFIALLTDLTNATTYGVSGFIQSAAITAIEDCQEAEAATSALYTRRRNLAIDRLKGANALRISPPQGAMYVMLDVRATGLSGYDFAHRLLDERRIAVMPGESFGSAAAGHIRVALTIDDNRLGNALDDIAEFAGTLAE